MENQTDLDTVIWLAVISLFCLAMMIILFFNTYRRKIFEKESKIRTMELENQLRIFRNVTEAEEEQREKIAKNLHDGVIPVISAVERSIDKNINDYGTDMFDLTRLKNDLFKLEEIAVDIRGISHDLAPQVLLSLGLFKALEDYLHRINDSSESRSEFENTVEIDLNSYYSVKEQVNIYRICLELLNNLLKHSRFKYLKLIVEKTPNYLDFVFMHNGKGVTNEQIEKLTDSATGLGLKSLRSRALLLNAKFDYLVEAETATVILSIPINEG